MTNNTLFGEAGDADYDRAAAELSLAQELGIPSHLGHNALTGANLPTRETPRIIQLPGFGTLVECPSIERRNQARLN